MLVLLDLLSAFDTIIDDDVLIFRLSNTFGTVFKDTGHFGIYQIPVFSLGGSQPTLCIKCL